MQQVKIKHQGYRLFYIVGRLTVGMSKRVLCECVETGKRYVFREGLVCWSH